MENRLRNLATPLSIAVAALCLQPVFTSVAADMPQTKGTTPSAFCKVPATPATTPEQTAWQIFTAINCSTNGQLTWETWTEQTCLLNPATAGCGPGIDAAKRTRHLHASRLALKVPGVPGDPSARLSGDCSPMTTTSTSPPSLKPFVPKNLAKGANFCEEVYVNQAEASYIMAPPGGQGATLQTLAGQQAYSNSTGVIQFPTGAIEVKADWLPAEALTTPFNCTTNKPSGVHVETIAGKCYALVGMHISSKLYPNWLWATFEPQNDVTNPNRCNPKLYSECRDPWGSNPAKSTGKKTAATKNLTNLMDQAGLAEEFRNYRLVGVQTKYEDPTLLGNSFVEFNAGVPAGQASCITCHSYAMLLSSKSPPAENPNFGAFPPLSTGTPPYPGTPPAGKPGLPPTATQGGGTWIPQDFSWLLGIMPAGAPKPK